MNETAKSGTIRVLTGSVAERRTKATEEMGKVVGDELRKAGFDVKRHVVVKGETEHIQALVNNVSVDNEADVIVLVGGNGIGPHENATEAILKISERQIEGFAESYRRLLRNDLGVHAILTRAAAGVYNQCIVFSLTGRVEDVRLAVEVLIAPILADAVSMAYGRPPPPREG